MATYVLVPGADGTAWYWHLVAPLLRAEGHEVVTLDLPSHDTANLDEFAEAIAAAVHAAVPDAAAPGAPLVLVAQSLGGFSAPLVCGKLPVDRLVLVNAMVPSPGESAGEWWGNVGQAEAREAYAAALGRTGADAEFDPRTDFFHDVPAALTEEAFASEPAGPPPGVFAQPWPLPAWPDVPTRFLQGRGDRFFPLEFQRRLARERLGLDVEELPGGHLVALSHPRELADALLRSA
ncbi:Alpha/beta hydrolase family protein [Actinacidiphila yanglinensis]|uniref:Alpha/beta hydrolase family protein n=1 Tax=Actinacidiphila yanglinensis TaxID=310779 RepID=A0A1H5XS80_9ACTN|nr:alpha/beta hydrolase [Actinacidiphila yanglinensis]SEG14639.1 Alpha/beta hydrolase family protein [Actinacidiphila yanglinensis]